MKVPTYTSQSLQTAKTGAGSFSVQASPANTAMGFAAQGEFLSQLQGTSLKFLEIETKMQRQTELSQAENALDFEMNSVVILTEQKDKFLNVVNHLLFLGRKLIKQRNNLNLPLFFTLSLAGLPSLAEALRSRPSSMLPRGL